MLYAILPQLPTRMHFSAALLALPAATLVLAQQHTVSCPSHAAYDDLTT